MLVGTSTRFVSETELVRIQSEALQLKHHSRQRVGRGEGAFFHWGEGAVSALWKVNSSGNAQLLVEIRRGASESLVQRQNRRLLSGQ